MILFLDVISPKPKFFITDNNKVIESLHILDRNFTKISDCIHDKFLFLQRKYNLLDLLDYLIVTTGPGSYTGLRVGISFMLGMSYVRKIPIYGIRYTEFFFFFIMEEDYYKTLVIICSANNQNFVCFTVSHNNFQYRILLISDEHTCDTIDLKLYSKCITNYNLPDYLKKKVCSTIKKIEYIDFEGTFHENYLSIMNNENILHPVYISDNRLFD